MQTGQLNCLFHKCTDLVNRAGVRQSTDWLLSNINHIIPYRKTLSRLHLQFSTQLVNCIPSESNTKVIKRIVFSATQTLKHNPVNIHVNFYSQV